MSAGKLRTAGELLFGSRWQSELARALAPFRYGATPVPLNDRVVRRWLAADTPVPMWVWPGLISLLETHAANALAYARHLRLLGRDSAVMQAKESDVAEEGVVVVSAMDLPFTRTRASGRARTDDDADLELLLDLSDEPGEASRSDEPVIAKVLARATYRGSIVYLAVADDFNGAPFFAGISENSDVLLSVRKVDAGNRNVGGRGGDRGDGPSS